MRPYKFCTLSNLAPYAQWNRSGSSSERGADPADASNRIFDGYYKPMNLPEIPKLSVSDPVFTMGSCFAREIEAALLKRGVGILSMDLDLLKQSGLFEDEKGVRTGFFHRFSLPSMEIELRRSVGEIKFDERKHLMGKLANGTFADMNYYNVLARLDLDGAVARRRISSQLVARFRTARAIVITLGLCEAWFHRPSQMVCNSVPGELLKGRPEDFELRLFGFQENMQALERIYRCIEKHHRDGKYWLFVTVSPVPLSPTFSGQDVVVANMRSKTTLRTVAEEFCNAHDKAIYFPSYEIAMYSRSDLVWRPDRVHVQPDCVRHITDTFIEQYIDVRESAAAA